MNDLVFTIAKREKVNPLLGVFGKSGSGKTLSALKLARGIVGPNGRIAVTDTENKRASHFADDPSVAPFKALDLQGPFSPEMYRKCHEAACKDFDIHVIDSASHEWNGDGGCLQMVEAFLDQKAGEDWAKRDKYKMAAWAKVSPDHELLVSALMRSPIPVICCFRAKDKVVMEKNDQGKTQISTDFDAPIARKDLIYEMLMAFECHQMEKEGVQSGGYFHIRKPGPPSLQRALADFKEERLSTKMGQVIAQWCANPVGPGQQQPLKAPKEIADLKKELWALTKEQHQEQPRLLDQFLIDENLISDTETISEAGADRLRKVIEDVKVWFSKK